jgi:hypothetical protein
MLVNSFFFFIWSLRFIKSLRFCVENVFCCCHNSIIIPILLQLRLCFLQYPTIPAVLFHLWYARSLICIFLGFQEPLFLCQIFSRNRMLDTVSFFIRSRDQSRPSNYVWIFTFKTILFDLKFFIKIIVLDV